jgi:hypothetical protein
MSAPSSGTKNFHMIEAVPERLEGAPRQFRRRWSDEFKERAEKPSQVFVTPYCRVKHVLWRNA